MNIFLSLPVIENIIKYLDSDDIKSYGLTCKEVYCKKNVLVKHIVPYNKDVHPDMLLDLFKKYPDINSLEIYDYHYQLLQIISDNYKIKELKISVYGIFHLDTKYLQNIKHHEPETLTPKD